MLPVTTNTEKQRIRLDGNLKLCIRQIFQDSKEDRNKEESEGKGKGTL